MTVDNNNNNTTTTTNMICSTATASTLTATKRRLLQLCLDKSVLLFGSFVLKSRRVSPYFLNLGALSDGLSLATLADSISEQIICHGTKFDVIFGAAYKGIPLAAATSISLSRLLGKSVQYCFNRKEHKGHGEGGQLVGNCLCPGTSVIVIDDVITAGTAVNEVVHLLQDVLHCKVVAVMTLFDRMETAAEEGPSEGGVVEDEGRQQTTTQQQQPLDDHNTTATSGGGRSASELVSCQLGVVVRSVLCLDDLLLFLNEKTNEAVDVEDSNKFKQFSSTIKSYQLKYGVSAIARDINNK
eukprot:GHVS01041964.1.p1 GENE.GHVS01041964.1~~GHVS01041964.1.p1  ORF type:complete len:298 (+),score=69.86 GHVS01041964.1:248-1141(+)